MPLYLTTFSYTPATWTRLIGSVYVGYLMRSLFGLVPRSLVIH